ncbi:MAG: sulfurtransferase TusA family protein [Acidobacteria bacterium]|nr:sulfurtransferase TusA family protein [Acidobacteriota bacterium]
MEQHKQDKMLDCSGLLCPMPVVKTNKALKELQVGQILEMIATDPGAVPDMEAWAKQTRHELLLVEPQDDGKFRFMIRKTH